MIFIFLAKVTLIVSFCIGSWKTLKYFVFANFVEHTSMYFVKWYGNCQPLPCIKWFDFHFLVKVALMLAALADFLWNLIIQNDLDKSYFEKFKSTYVGNNFFLFWGNEKKKVEKEKDSQTQEIAVFFGLFYRPRGCRNAAFCIHYFLKGKKVTNWPQEMWERPTKENYSSESQFLYWKVLFFLEKNYFPFAKTRLIFNQKPIVEIIFSNVIGWIECNAL